MQKCTEKTTATTTATADEKEENKKMREEKYTQTDKVHAKSAIPEKHSARKEKARPNSICICMHIHPYTYLPLYINKFQSQTKANHSQAQ